jgi:DNA-binding PadR family transcriptional regulator
MSTLDLNPTAASLLGFLLDGPKTGWDLVQAIERSVGYFWNVTRSQVYRELKTLAAAELVTASASGPRDRLPYAITSSGRRAFLAFLEADAGGETLRLPIVVKVFFGDQLPAEVLRRHVDAARAEHAATLATYEMIAAIPGGGPKNAYQRKCLELGMAYEKMILAWMNELPEADAKRRAKKNPKRAT